MVRGVGVGTVVSRAVVRASPVLAAVMIVSCTGPPAFDGAMHDATRGYLHAVADGGSRAAFFGACGVGHEQGTDRVVAAEGPRFTFSFTSSTRSDDSGTVNVSITGRDGTPSPYSLDLRRENGRWVVCGMDEGTVAIDVDVDVGMVGMVGM